jgi:hypothetical protein
LIESRTERPAQADSSARRVEGKVVRGTREGPRPVANQWVIVHRVGRDRAGPLDSVRTNAAGAYSIRYRATGDSSAIYFASTSYGGIAYFTSPLRGERVSGDDAQLTVFDTTSGPVAIKVGGRHLIIGTPGPDGSRPIGEVYDLQNDSTVTAVARDSVTPVWTAHIPPAATSFRLNTNGDLAAGSIMRRDATIGVLVPISPGIRQIAFTYDLPAKAFPLSVPAERETGVFEILVQEPTARVQGPNLREVPPVSTEGRTFRRFLAQDLVASAVVRVDVPRVVGKEREKVYVGVATVMLAAMAAALVLTARRSFSLVRGPHVPRAEPRSQELLRAIAALDAEFESGPPKDAAATQAYEDRRAAMKAELMEALAAERRRT